MTRAATDDAAVRTGTGYAGAIIRDPADVRDLIYRPSLGSLPEKFLCAAVDPASPVLGGILAIRDQGERPTCIGEALAALVDIQRIETYRRRPDVSQARADLRPCSAAMLHAMALDIESTDLGQRAADITSLRSGLKGFYNTGVCSEATWNNAGDSFDSASVASMREARSVTLGAYYRVRSFINDCHAALVEAGALYVSAEVHGGWNTVTDGVIGPRPKTAAPTDAAGGHAFVIVGYDRDGFLVLNSWGRDWGQYRFDGTHPLPGVALWRYEDWAAHVIDAWVLRLAAPTPEAFRYSIGQHGTAMFGADQAPLGAPSVRRLEVLGRYIHLDDGHHVGTGSYPSSRQSVATTMRHVATKASTGLTDIRLTIHGDTMPTANVMLRLARSIPTDKASNIHGISLVWINGLLSGSAEALKPLFDAALKIAKGNRDDADRQIEAMSRPVGRALWRDVKRAAAIAGHPRDGDAAHALRAIVRLCNKHGLRLHVLTEGAGVLLLSALIGDGKGGFGTDGDFADALESLTLVAPLITPQDYKATIGPFLVAWGKTTGRRAMMFKPDPHFDERLCVGAYSRSWTDLVSRAFEEEPTLLIGAHDFKADLPGDPLCRELGAPERPSGDLSSDAVLQHETVAAYAVRVIRTAPTRRPPH